MVVRVPRVDRYVEGEKGLVNGTEWNRWEQIGKYQNCSPLRNGLCNSRVNGSVIAAESSKLLSGRRPPSLRAMREL